MKLNKVSDDSKMVTVTRDGQQIRLHEEEIFTGDIMKLEIGMVFTIDKFKEIPADGVIVEASDILIDESSMTGETHHIKKGTIESCLKKK